MTNRRTPAIALAVAGSALIAVAATPMSAQDRPSPPGPPSSPPGDRPPGNRPPGDRPPGDRPGQADRPGETGADRPWIKGYIASPPGSQTLAATLDSSAVQLFQDKDFKGTQASLDRVDAMNPQGGANNMPDDLNDSLSSARWNLPRGVIVVFYEDATPKGEQLVLWGSGQMSDLGTWDFDDKASRWAWYNIGGGAPMRGETRTVPPIGSESLDADLPMNAVHLYKDQNFGEDMQQLSPVSGVPAGALQDLPRDLNDSLSSLQWSLPPGVIVMLYEDADGKKDRVAVWGEAQIADLDHWDFNDKASRWSWAYIGDPGPGMGRPGDRGTPDRPGTRPGDRPPTDRPPTDRPPTDRPPGDRPPDRP